MAKYRHDIIPPFVGTRGCITIYKMYDRYYARAKSSLTGKRVKKDKAFRRTMDNANRLAAASRIASAVYRLVPAESKQHTLYRKLTGMAIERLKQDYNPVIVEQGLKEWLAKEISPVTQATSIGKTGRRVQGTRRKRRRSIDKRLPTYAFICHRYLRYIKKIPPLLFPSATVIPTTTIPPPPPANRDFPSIHRAQIQCASTFKPS